MAIFFTVFRQAIVLIPLLYILPALWNITGIWIAIPASDLAAFTVSAIFLYRELKKMGKYKVEVQEFGSAGLQT